MYDLQERVQKMLDGEAKRRDIALKWLGEIEEILLPASEDIWGEGDNFGDPSYTITLTKFDGNNKKIDSQIYFRYADGDTGFYDGSKTHCNRGGEPIEDLKGSKFWAAIRIIIDWIPQIIEEMDKREESRNALLTKIR